MNYLKPTVVVLTTFIVLFFLTFNHSIYAQESKAEVQIKSINFPDKIGINETILVTGYLDVNTKFSEHLRSEFNYVILPSDKNLNSETPKAQLTKDIIIKQLKNGQLYFEQAITINPRIFKIPPKDIQPQNVVMIWPTNFKGANSPVKPHKQNVTITANQNSNLVITPTIEVLEINLPKQVAVGETIQIEGYLKIVGEAKEYKKMGLSYQLASKNNLSPNDNKLSKNLQLRPIVSEDSLIFKHEIVIDETLLKNIQDENGDIEPENVVMIWPTNFKNVHDPKGTKPLFQQAITIKNKNMEANNTPKPKRK